MGPGVDALSPENVLVFGTGLLSVTSAPCPARFNVTAKSPLTGILGDANAGCFFGPAMRKAGVEHIIIRGKANEPVYLHINDDQIEVRSEKNAWGKGSGEAEQAIRWELGDPKVRVATMGPAGENMSRIANVLHEERSASRTGMGAVMGSKNLKAVAVKVMGKWATEPVPNGENEGEILDPEKWEGMLDDYYRLRGWTEQGVPTKEKLK